jgi:hypothetical protein
MLAALAGVGAAILAAKATRNPWPDCSIILPRTTYFISPLIHAIRKQLHNKKEALTSVSQPDRRGLR